MLKVDCSGRWRLQRKKRVQVRPRRRLRRGGSRTARGKRPPVTEINPASSKLRRTALEIHSKERAVPRMRGIYGNSLYHFIFYLRSYIRLIF